ncbi:B3 domain-containing protein Os06g0194400 isoform X1 [Cryptomeria japonica]|nr:B3 domain-containing protein Os06g0194400 isoform X1 [Cryptomeria japonica]
MEMPNSYEEHRRQRVEANKKILMDLGLQQLKENLVQTVASESKSKKREVKSPKPKQQGPVERRCSTRVSRLPVPIYREVDDSPRSRKSRAKHDSKRFLHSSIASYEARTQAQETAETSMKDLGSEHPYFVKSLVRSHVSSCFWLGLPRGFCVKYLPENDVSMVLEDEKGNECDTVYIATRTGLSGGWRGFALDHDLDDGDALVFELVEPTKFKVYITKAKDFESGTTSKKASSMNGNLPEESGAARKSVVKKTSNMKSVKKNSPREQKKINSKRKGEQVLTLGKVTSTMLNSKKGNASKKVPASQTQVRTITMSQATENVNNDQSTRVNKRGRAK